MRVPHLDFVNCSVLCIAAVCIQFCALSLQGQLVKGRAYQLSFPLPAVFLSLCPTLGTTDNTLVDSLPQVLHTHVIVQVHCALPSLFSWHHASIDKLLFYCLKVGSHWIFILLHFLQLQKFLPVNRERSNSFSLAAALCPLWVYCSSWHRFLVGICFVSFCHEKHLQSKSHQ